LDTDHYEWNDRREAAAYLKGKYGPGGITCGTLAKFATTGGGPVMHRFGRRVSYLRRDLDEWAMARCSGPMRSTSDVGGRHE